MTEVVQSHSILESADGRLNSYTFHCDTIGQRKTYPVCLSLIVNQNEKRLEILYADCIGAIKKGSCPAIAMRKKEESAGHAMFFQPRHADMPVTVAAVRPKKTGLNRPEPKPEGLGIFDRIVDDSYADALNKAVAASVVAAPVKAVVVPVQPAVKPETTIKAVPGESLLEMARRMIAAKTLP